MSSTVLQEKINTLHDLAHRLLHMELSGNYLYADDLPQLNNNIHEQINELYIQQGKTDEQEASLCLALLLGFSVSMYASPGDDFKRQTILKRSQNILETLSPSSLKEDLLTVYKEYQII